MPAYNDLTNQQIHDWTVLRRSSSGPGGVKFACRCKCGMERDVIGASLTSGKSRNCGCVGRERWIARSTKHGAAPQAGGTRAYNSWKHMRARCSNPNHKDFHYYGGRGIKVAPEWDDFSKFLEDMGDPPPGMSIDRIDCNGGYNKKNCRWATKTEQTANRRPFKQIQPKGENSPGAKLKDDIVKEIRLKAETSTQSKIAAEYGISQSLVSMIVRRKIWSHI